MNTFQTLATFTYPYEYAVLQTLLEEAGLRFFFQNETTVSVAPFYSNALGGIQLKVHRKDVGEALKIMDKLQHDGKLRIVR